MYIIFNKYNIIYITLVFIYLNMDYIFEINNGGYPWTTSSGDVQCYRFDLFVMTERRLHRSIIFIASNATSAIWNGSATRSLVARPHCIQH